MIPVEVTLRNFMCYDESGGDGYRYNFRDHRLWSICGDNGAGKSAIFDAITYTLFGHHRGGERRDEELIRKGANEMACAFSFEHFGRLYRVTRTIRRRVRRTGEAAYDRACQLDWYDEANTAWREVSGCSTATGLEEHVRTVLLGFDYDTFISSVLLLQGDSDKLLRSKASERFSYLSGILDLRIYARLEKVAWSRAKTFRDQSQVLAQRVQEFGIPAAKEVQQANDKASLLASEEVKSSEWLKAAEQRLGRVALFWELSRRREQFDAKVKSMANAQANEAAIRKDAGEKRLLNEALPRLTDAVRSLADADAASRDAGKARKLAELIDIDAKAKAVTDAETKWQLARQGHESKSAEMKKARESHRTLEPVVVLAGQLRDLRANIDRAKAEVGKIQKELGPLDGLRTRLDRLEILHRTQSTTKSYAEAQKHCAQLLDTFGASSPAYATSVARAARVSAEGEIGILRSAVAEKQEQLGGARGELAIAEESLRQREEAGAEGKCSHCGQTVSTAHIRREIATVRKEVVRLKSTTVGAEEQLQARTSQLKECLDRLPALLEAEQRLVQRADNLQQATARVAALKADGLDEIPSDVRTGLGGEPSTIDAVLNRVSIELAELGKVRSEVSNLSSKEADVRAHRSLIARWETERAVILQRITLPEAETALTQAAGFDKYFAEAEPQETALHKAVETAAAALGVARIKYGEAVSKKAELSASVKLHDTTAAGHSKAAATAVKGLDPQLLPPTKKRIEEAQRRLSFLKDAEVTLALLETAMKELDGVRGQLLEIAEQLSKVPDVDRIRLDEATLAVNTARSQHSSIQDEARGARDHAVAIAKQREERLEMEKKAVELAKAHRIWDRLAKLLGRGGLQLALMKRDLAAIEHLANVMLGKISGGMLHLSIECTQRAGAEEIVFRCIDGGSAEDALDVAFLSGGQKFRVAVALAAGIGQYAGVGGSMPSQIIDEGFGSLDEKGRREMLDQIREMSEHFERIIVVSHTDSFHDPALFPARYELHKEGRKTVVVAYR